MYISTPPRALRGAHNLYAFNCGHSSGASALLLYLPASRTAKQILDTKKIKPLKKTCVFIFFAHKGRITSNMLRRTTVGVLAVGAASAAAFSPSPLAGGFNNLGRRIGIHPIHNRTETTGLRLLVVTARGRVKPRWACAVRDILMSRFSMLINLVRTSGTRMHVLMGYLSGMPPSLCGGVVCVFRSTFHGRGVCAQTRENTP